MASIPSRGAAPMLVLLASLLCLLLPGASAEPSVSVTHFQTDPSKLFYFDDSSVALLQESPTTIQRSDDEGKTWKKVEEVDDVLRLIDHPFSKEIAFVIGRHTKHWVTHNRGASWQSFETKRPATKSGQPLTFHAQNPDWILFQGTVCEKGHSNWPWGGSETCWDETYYTSDAFRSEPSMMLDLTSQCSFARSTEASEAPERLVLCLAFDSKPENGHRASDARLYSSQDWFKSKDFVDLGIGKAARGIVGLGIVSKFIVVALRSPGEDKRAAGNPMMLYVSTDGANFHQAQFPHSALPDLVENAYTIVESTTHSIAVDILTQAGSNIGTLFVSSGDGTYFVESLPDTNRNEWGIVGFEAIYGLEGIAIANTVKNREQVVTGNEVKKLSTRITFDDGSTWAPLKPPATKLDGSAWECDVSDTKKCSLHLHSVTKQHNLGRVFSSTAPGYVMAVGSVGDSLKPYDECETFLSTDAGLTWKVAREGAHVYEFGDQGSILVLADDEASTDKVVYSTNGGKEWKELDLGITVRVNALTTIPDSTSQKFLILGTASRGGGKGGRYVAVNVDFEGVQPRQCKEDDLEPWYARSQEGSECLMGHKQWYKRRKVDAECYVGNKFEDPVGHEENCACTNEDYECDFNYVRQDGTCVSVGPEPVPPGVCKSKDATYKGSSGYRKIPGNTCDRDKGVKLDEQVEKPCSGAKPEDGKAVHAIHPFESQIDKHFYFPNSQTILLHLADGTVWQSSNAGYSWAELDGGDRDFLTVMLHPYDDERAYLITNDRTIFYTTDTGASWNTMRVPQDANTLGIAVLDFHPNQPDWLIWTGSVDCAGTLPKNCHAIAYYTTDHGRNWREVEKYVRACQWSRGDQLKADPRMITCESYKQKSGSQKLPGAQMELVAGKDYYKRKTVLFDSVVGWAEFSEYMLVAAMHDDGNLELQASLDGEHFALTQFPPNIKIANHAYTILESNTHSVFMLMTMNTGEGKEWGSIFKSNSNGTYYSLALEHVNRNANGYVDFEKMIGLDGIAVVNIVSNPDAAQVSGKKKLQSRITHNDGARWKPLTPPAKDSLGRKYECDTTACSLQIHGYTERKDPKATYSSPSAPGVMLAIGNVGEELAAYDKSDVFLTRDGGFTWEEVHKDAHMWEYGDSGSIIVLVNDEEATDHVLFSTNQGSSWHTYSFGERLRISSIQTVPQDTSRKFFLIGQKPSQKDSSVLVYLDFSSVLTRKCELNPNDPNNDDFELWSPAENRQEKCLFGRQTLYHRRLRDADCYVGEVIKQPNKIERNCECTAADFECEFNHYRSDKGECVLVDGATPLDKFTTQAEQCFDLTSSWYERTAYRKIPYSTCEGGERLDRGVEHPCPGLVGRQMGSLFWLTLIILPFALTGFVAYYWYSKSGRSPGAIRLGEHRAYGGDGAGKLLSVAASVPYFLLGLMSAGWSALERRVPFVEGLFSRRTPYRAVPIDDDAELLGGYEDDE